MSSEPGRFAPGGSADDRYALWDAAYVLGALSPVDRNEFEGHLATCDRCRSAVTELAALPGLLAQLRPQDVSAVTVDPLAEADDAPLARRSADTATPALLPDVLARARRRRARLAQALVGVAAAVVLLVGGLAGGYGLGTRGDRGPQLLAFQSVDASDLTAVVNLVPSGTGTEVEVECQYGAAPEDDEAEQYAIVVIDRQGRAEQVKEWPVSPNKVMRPSGITPWSLDQISNIQIREVSTGHTVLEATLR